MKHFIYCLIACFTLSLGLVACEPKDENDPIPPENKDWGSIYHYNGDDGTDEEATDENRTEEDETEEQDLPN